MVSGGNKLMLVHHTAALRRRIIEESDADSPNSI
jgi:hypothetical protein